AISPAWESWRGIPGVDRSRMESRQDDVFDRIRRSRMRTNSVGGFMSLPKLPDRQLHAAVRSRRAFRWLDSRRDAPRIVTNWHLAVSDHDKLSGERWSRC